MGRLSIGLSKKMSEFEDASRNVEILAEDPR